MELLQALARGHSRADLLVPEPRANQRSDRLLREGQRFRRPSLSLDRLGLQQLQRPHLRAVAAKLLALTDNQPLEHGLGSGVALEVDQRFTRQVDACATSGWRKPSAGSSTSSDCRAAVTASSKR